MTINRGPMNQSKLESLAESLINILIGYTVAVVSQIIIFPIFDVPDMPLSVHMEIGLWFTVVSLMRSYMIRRWFNAGLHKAAVRMVRGIRGWEA